MIKPIFTEKSLRLAKEGQYSFIVEQNTDKSFIKSEIGKLFDVHVVAIKTLTLKSESKRNAKGRKIATKPVKKAIVVLKEGEKIKIFEEVGK